MTVSYEFKGRNGMEHKVRKLASNCKSATEGLSRTLLLAITAPDPISTPDCETTTPRGFRIQTLDRGMSSADIALLLGAMMGFIEQIENGYAMEFGDEFHDLVDEARDSYGHSITMNVVPVEPQGSKGWKRRSQTQKS